MQLIKKQVYLTPRQEFAVKKRAKGEKISDSEVVRRALELYFQQTEKQVASEGFFASLIGSGTTKPGHSSETIDIDLYGSKLP